jgi:hypothetical protein
VVISATVVASVGISIRPSRISYSLVVNEVSAIMRVVLNVVLSIPCGDVVVILTFVVLFGGKVFVCFNAACSFVVRLGFVVVSLLAVLLTYTALYWASLAIIPKPLIAYWASVKAIGFKPILDMPMLIIYLTSPFNAYESLMFHYPPWLYFIESVVVPTVVLAAEVIITLWTSEYVLGREILSESFLIQSFALAIVSSYMTSLIAWVGGGKPSIGTSIYTEYVFAATVYVAVVSTWDLFRRLVVSRGVLARVYVGAVITAIAMPALVAAYLATELLFKPPIPTTHIVGLIPTVTLIVTHHKLTTKLRSKTTQPI